MSCCRVPAPTVDKIAAGLLRTIRNQYDRVPQYQDVTAYRPGQIRRFDLFHVRTPSIP